MPIDASVSFGIWTTVGTIVCTTKMFVNPISKGRDSCGIVDITNISPGASADSSNEDMLVTLFGGQRSAAVTLGANKII